MEVKAVMGSIWLPRIGKAASIYRVLLLSFCFVFYLILSLLLFSDIIYLQVIITVFTQISCGALLQDPTWDLSRIIKKIKRNETNKVYTWRGGFVRLSQVFGFFLSFTSFSCIVFCSPSMFWMGRVHELLTFEISSSFVCMIYLWFPN